MVAGYAGRHVRLRVAGVLDQVFPRRGWRRVRIGPIELRVPPGWGPVEPDVADGYIIHNRPRRYRVDGDAVWYATAIEFRIRRHDPVVATHLSAMPETTKTIGSPDGPIVLAVAIANGVGERQRRDALRVLNKARRLPGDHRMVWGVTAAQQRREIEGPTPFHPRISGPYRR